VGEAAKGVPGYAELDVLYREAIGNRVEDAA